MRTVIEGQLKRKKYVKKIIKVTAVLTLFLVIVLTAIPPLIMGGMINQSVQFSQVYQASDYDLDAQELHLTTEDGYQISAFEVEVERPKAIIIFISGIHNPSVTAFFGHAKMASDNGYASILYDMRAHGESEGEVISLGYRETLDTQAVVDYIRSQEKYREVPIVVYGLSMGGAVAINSIGQIPEIAALISMSAYSSWQDVFIENMIALGAPKMVATMQRPFLELYTAYKFGLNTRNIYPENQIKNLGDRPALIMHSTNDSEVSFSNFERIIAQAPSHVETFTREGDYHFFTTDILHPENDKEYAQRVLAFLDSHLGD
ncbi:alpha/beta hydrolase [Bacillus alkalicellulosilyticus]|uniref:alpha/beta hydrolase n=1 Tax=Alkalihalobacterium alkalicellulosilyticum TaxID=1912214 RepID=UPI0009986CB8|nr:alpha/beta hydrolase [Bacillus alkalicellulosilyticus]